MQLPYVKCLFAALALSGAMSVAAQTHFVAASAVAESAAADQPLAPDTDTAIAQELLPAASAASVAAPRQPRLTQVDAANIVRKLGRGQVMAVQPRVHNGKTDYAVKVLDAGRMRTITLDGDTGEVR